MEDEKIGKTNLGIGLTNSQVAEKVRLGKVNSAATPPTKSVAEILRSNLITPFNLLNLVLAVCVILVGSWKNLLFMGVIVSNAVIGIVQELRAKRSIDNLSILAAPKAHVRRNGETVELPLEQLVEGDVVVLSAGNQVGADCVISEGECAMDEALLTGESEPVFRAPGDLLLSGSFVLSGHCLAQVVHVGEENYAAQVTAEAKKWKPPQSEILNAVNQILRVMGVILAPIGVALFLKQWFFVNATPQEAVVATVAALVGMIPEGLVLLTSVVLAVSVVRLAGKKALAQELYSIEMLARVDVLCLDKTGTLTTGDLTVKDLISLKHSETELKAALSCLLSATKDENPTATALGRYVGQAPDCEIQQTAPFRSDRKWSGARFQGQSWCLGALEFLFPHGCDALDETAQGLAAQGLRVLAVAVSDRPFGADNTLPPELRPAGLAVLSDTLRPGVADTLAYFKSQGVTLKIISGDHPATVSAVARGAGLTDADTYIDASTLKTEEEVKAAAEQYAVFGRVTPKQKKWLVEGLQAQGHKVAMTGDGVNDVAALRQSDCAVALAAGSEAARNVSQIVLLTGDFSVLPHIVAEGRRAINNLTRSASLFLTKTCFSTMIATFFLAFTVAYPFQPIQLSLISTLTIGIPSFLLALEPNWERIQGNFLQNVLKKALPGGIAMATDVLWCVALLNWFPLSRGQLTTLCVLAVGLGGLINLLYVCLPWKPWRVCLLAALAAAFALAARHLGWFFSLTPLTAPMTLMLLGLALWNLAIDALLRRILRNHS